MRDANERHLKLNEMSATGLEMILNYFYTRSVTVTMKNVEQILETASYLLVEPVKEACVRLLRKHIDSSNYYSIRRLAVRFSVVDLVQTTDDYINKYFHVICKSCTDKTSEYLEFSVEVLAVISRDELMVKKEEDVYFAVLSWVRHDVNNRQKYLQDLLERLRYGFLPVTFLREQIEKEPLLKENAKV